MTIEIKRGVNIDITEQTRSADSIAHALVDFWNTKNVSEVLSGIRNNQYPQSSLEPPILFIPAIQTGENAALGVGYYQLVQDEDSLWKWQKLNSYTLEPVPKSKPSENLSALLGLDKIGEEWREEAHSTMIKEAYLRQRIVNPEKERVGTVNCLGNATTQEVERVDLEIQLSIWGIKVIIDKLMY